MKTAFAAICVVAAGISGMKAYNNANQSRSDMLLAANVEALSYGDNFESPEQEYDAIRQCSFAAQNEKCSYISQGTMYSVDDYTSQQDRSDAFKNHCEGED